MGLSSRAQPCNSRLAACGIAGRGYSPAARAGHRTRGIGGGKGPGRSRRTRKASAGARPGWQLAQPRLCPAAAVPILTPNLVVLNPNLLAAAYTSVYFFDEPGWAGRAGAWESGLDSQVPSPSVSNIHPNPCSPLPHTCSPSPASSHSFSHLPPPPPPFSPTVGHGATSSGEAAPGRGRATTGAGWTVANLLGWLPLQM